MITTRILIFILCFCSYLPSVYGQNQLVADIPFRLNHEHIIIKVSINGEGPFNFLFDSGAGGTLMSRSLVDSLGMSIATERTNTGAAGTHKVGLVRGVDLRLGDAQINNISIMRDENDMEELDNGESVGGIIGFHVLSRFVVRIDYDRQILRLYNRANYQYNGDGAAIPITLSYNIPAIDGQLFLDNQSISGKFLVDTGARSDLLISSPTVVKYNLSDQVGDHYVLRTTVGSSQKKVKIMYARFPGFEFADQKFDNVPAVLSSTLEGVLSFDDIDGIIGNRMLQRYNLTFDYQRSMMYIEPSLNFNRKYRINSSGFSIYFKHGEPYIKDIVDRSPARKAGLKEDDKIISVNGELVEELTKQEIRDTFYQVDTVVKLVVQRGLKLKYTEISLKELI